MKYYQIVNKVTEKVIIEWNFNDLLLNYGLKDDFQKSLFISEKSEKFQKYNPSYKLSVKIIEEVRKPEIPFYCLPNFGWPLSKN